MSLNANFVTNVGTIHAGVAEGDDEGCAPIPPSTPRVVICSSSLLLAAPTELKTGISALMRRRLIDRYPCPSPFTPPAVDPSRPGRTEMADANVCSHTPPVDPTYPNRIKERVAMLLSDHRRLLTTGGRRDARFVQVFVSGQGPLCRLTQTKWRLGFSRREQLVDSPVRSERKKAGSSRCPLICRLTYQFARFPAKTRRTRHHNALDHSLAGTRCVKDGLEEERGWIRRSLMEAVKNHAWRRWNENA
jgi:hypothetical protein